MANEIESFTHGSLAENNVSADIASTANLVVKAETIGECGDLFEYALVLHSNNTESMDISSAIDLSTSEQSAIFSESGLEMSIDVARDDAQYWLYFSIEATESPREDDYVKIFAEDTSEQFVYGGIPCAVQIYDFNLFEHSVSEISLNSFGSEWSFVLEWEPNCENLKATVKIFNSDDEVVGSSSINHSAILNEDWYVDVATEDSNEFGEYYAKLYFTDIEHETAVQHAGPIYVNNVPLCHLYVDSFDQTAFDFSVDEAHFELGVHVALSHAGDNACLSSEATVSLMAGDNVVFVHEISASDLAAANSGSFDFSIVEDVDAAVSRAVVNYTDSNAPVAAAANFDIVAAAAGPCEIEIENFCLIDVIAGEAEADATFDFSLVVRSTPSCADLEVSIDIVQEGQYLGNVVIDAADVVSAVECNCDTTFSVTAPAAVTGEFYGQIDVREPTTGKIYISDSTPFTAQ